MSRSTMSSVFSTSSMIRRNRREVLEHAGKHGLALLAAHLDEILERAADPVPAGDDVPVLRPGEHPRDGAEIGEALGAEAPRRPRADIEQRDFFERARRLEIGDEVGIADEPRVGGARGAGQRFHGVVDLGAAASAPPRARISAHARTRSRRAAPSDRPAVPRLAYLEDTTSPCSVTRNLPRIEPAGWAAMARPVGAPPRETEPPRPWKKAIFTPVSSLTLVSSTCALASSQLEAKKPPSLFESE